jgi:hypothetical protein
VGWLGRKFAYVSGVPDTRFRAAAFIGSDTVDPRRSCSIKSTTPVLRAFIMSMRRQHAHFDLPLDVLWGLVGFPRRYPEWWPRVVEVRGEHFEQGDEFVQVTRRPIGRVQSHFLVEHREDMRGIRMSCQLSGSYAEWLLTPALGGTFIELEMGIEPKGFRYRVFELTVGGRYFEAWSHQSLEALRNAGRSMVQQ